MQDKPFFFFKILIALGVIAVLAVYLFHQSKIYLIGPRVAAETPKTGETLVKNLVAVKGQVSNTSSVLINGSVVLADNLGNFEEKLLLSRGYNIIELTARDRFGRETNKKIEVVIK